MKMKNKECLLKKTRFGKLEFCKDEFNFDRYSGHQIMECQRKCNVEHCLDCEFYPEKVQNEK